MPPLALRHLPSLPMAQVQVVLDTLTKAGYSDLFIIESALDEINVVDIEELLGIVGCPPDLRAAAAGDLVVALTAAAPVVRREVRLAAAPSLEHRAEVLAKRLRISLPDCGPQVVQSAFMPAGTRWPTKHKEQLSLAGGATQRRHLETEERDRQLALLATALRESQLPVVLLAESAADPEGLLRMTAGARRGTTIRNRVLQWRRMADWMRSACGKPWPPSVVVLIDYLCDVVDGGAPPSTPERIAAMISFFEKAGAVLGADRLSAHPLWLSAVRDTAARLAVDAPAPKKAAMFPAIFIIAMEHAVHDESYPLFKRFVAWVRLLKVWAALRSDDTEGMIPHELRITDAGLEGVLERSKTSGPGRRCRHLPFFVSHNAFLGNPGWLRCGYDLMKSSSLAFPRDYLVPLAAPEYDGVIHKMARYQDRALYGRALLVDLEPTLSDGIPTKFLAAWPRAAGYWTEHSERNFLPTVAAALGFDKNQRDYIGRWKPGAQSDDYVRSARQILDKLQGEVARRLRAEPSFIDEQDIRAGLVKYLRKFEVVQETVDELLAAITQAPGVQAPVAASSTYANGGGDSGSSDGFGDDDDPTPGGSDTPTTVDLAPGDAEELDADLPYWLCHTRNRQHRCLHRVGGCRLSPGVFSTPLDFEYLSALEVSTRVYDAKCKKCFPLQDGALGTRASGSSSSEGSSSDAPLNA
jgi:hypothetical protein